MTGVLAHQVTDDAVVVVLRPRGANPSSLRVTPTEARRFAWALLNDLDPDGAEAAGTPMIEYFPPSSAADADRDRAKWGAQPRRVIELLRDGQANTKRIAAVLGVTPRHAAVVLSKLKRDGVIEVVIRGRVGSPGVWRLKAGSRAYDHSPNQTITRPSPGAGEDRA